MNNKNIGDLIAQLRKEKNMTQKDLADQLNVTDKAVSKWERGISCPDINTIPKLAELLGVSSEELLRIEKNSTSNNSDSLDIKSLIRLIMKAVGLAMGVGVFVLSVLDKMESKSAITMLSIGLICIGISLFNNEQTK